MKSDKVDYTKIEELPDGADCLFKVMMRLEFALKENGFCVKAKTSQYVYAQVDWCKFNEYLGEEFFCKVKRLRIARVLIHSPPQRQIADDTGHLDWKKTTNSVSDTGDLMIAVRRVRNNLFHGGKHGDPDGDRNGDLICDALRVIDYILQHDPDLQRSFEGKY